MLVPLTLWGNVVISAWPNSKYNSELNCGSFCLKLDFNPFLFFHHFIALLQLQMATKKNKKSETKQEDIKKVYFINVKPIYSL